MAINDLKDVLKETLESRGVLQQIRARIRAEIFNSLHEDPQEKQQLTMGSLNFEIRKFDHQRPDSRIHGIQPLRLLTLRVRPRGGHAQRAARQGVHLQEIKNRGGPKFKTIAATLW